MHNRRAKSGVDRRAFPSSELEGIFDVDDTSGDNKGDLLVAVALGGWG